MYYIDLSALYLMCYLDLLRDIWEVLTNASYENAECASPIAHSLQAVSY